jgi:hypothetical protein
MVARVEDPVMIEAVEAVVVWVEGPVAIEEVWLVVEPR